MNETWQIKEVDAGLVARIVEKYDLPASVATILAGRTIVEEEIADFLEPRLQALSDPFLLPDMEQAVERLLRARSLGQQVLIWGDYDVDGICSTSILYNLLDHGGWSVRYFIPDRNTDGYGVTLPALKRLCETAKPDLMITVDCGTNSVAEIAYAASLHVDVIVTDHHVPASAHATPYALINPKLGEDRRFHDLCGAGVVFKLMHALIKRVKESSDEVLAQVDLKKYLDRVALATVADMVPLLGENRIFVQHGLKRMKQTSCVGLHALLTVTGTSTRISSSTCAYQLAPRLNATGRMASAHQGVALLTTSDEHHAHQLALDIDQLNQKRREAEERLFKQVIDRVERKGDTDKLWSIVLADKDWPVGLVGIAAARAVRAYHLPVILMQEDEVGGAKGSCRSIAGVDLLPILETCSEFLDRFGGHQMAAGLQVKPNCLDAFASCFAAGVQQQVGHVRPERILAIDVCISQERIDHAWYAQYQKLAPFGADFTEPVVMIKEAQIEGMPRVVGEKHLRFDLAWEGQSIPAIAFNFSLDQLPAGRLDVAGRIEENHWRGAVTLQIQVIAVKPAIRDLI